MTTCVIHLGRIYLYHNIYAHVFIILQTQNLYNNRKVKSLSRKMPSLARKANNQIETHQSGSNTKPTKKGTTKIKKRVFKSYTSGNQRL